MFETNPVDRIEQLDAMRRGVDYRLEIKVRGFSMMVRPLTVDEVMQVAATVQEKMTMIPDSAKNALTENVLLAKETLKLASTSDIGTNDPKITDYILGRMTTDELQCLHKQYVGICDKVNPMLEEMAAAELQALIDALKKSPLQLTELSFMEMANVCRHLIQEG